MIHRLLCGAASVSLTIVVLYAAQPATAENMTPWSGLYRPRQTYTVESDRIWTVRPLVGHAFGPCLTYGGLDMSHLNQAASFTENHTTPSTPPAVTDTGRTTGLGRAYALSRQWSVKAEWLYVDLGEVSGAATPPDGFANLASQAAAQGSLVRLALDYKF